MMAAAQHRPRVGRRAGRTGLAALALAACLQLSLYTPSLAGPNAHVKVKESKADEQHGKLNWKHSLERQVGATTRRRAAPRHAAAVSG